MPSLQLKPVKCPNNQMAFTNKVWLSPADGAALKVKKDEMFCKIKNMVFNFDYSDKISPGEIAMTNPQRSSADIGLADGVKLSLYSPSTTNIYLDTLSVTVNFVSPKKKNTHPYEATDIENLIKKNLEKQYLNVGQQFVLEWDSNMLIFVVTGLSTVNLDQLAATAGATPSAPSADATRGVLMTMTQINISRAANSQILLSGGASSNQSRALFSPNFKFEDMGIGGLDKEFGDIFRRAFASRIFPPSVVKKMGINHVRGILLYGPPGTGKTLMARQIGKMLNGREPKKVNGPEILNKFVGESEKNVRDLFAEAEIEYKERGDDSELHVIIFDEIDAICKQRGTRNDGTGVGDTVVNQLLSKIDGVDSLNNILLIGMTNRKDMIDEALLRPGRLEVHIEVSLPDETGRQQILKIHTQKLKDNNFLGKDVDIAVLAKKTKNFSGADIEGLVKAAVSNATTRHVDVNNPTKPIQADKILVSQADFERALDKDVKAAFGVAEAEFENTAPNGVLNFGPKFEKLMDSCRLRIEQVRNSARTPLVSILLVGERGSGKTAIAAELGLSSDFPYVKLVSPESLVGWSEAGKISKITKAFEDSYKSPLSVIIVDDLERLLDYAPLGPRFSNPILQTLMVLMNRPPPKGRRLLVIGTTTEPGLLNDLNFTGVFSSAFKIPSVETQSEMGAVLEELDVFDAATARQAVAAFSGPPIPIKRLIMLVEIARQMKGDLLASFQTVLAEESLKD